MNNAMNLIETDAEIQRAWTVTVTDEQIDDSMHTTPLEDEQASFGSNADVMMTITRSESRGFIAGEVDRIYAGGTQAKV